MTGEQESRWLYFTDGEYYNRLLLILSPKIGDGEAENLLANVWESGFTAGVDCTTAE